MSTWGAEPGVVTLPDGRRIRGVALRDSLRRAPSTQAPPDLAVHLAATRPPATPWEQRWIRWPDFLLPVSTLTALRVLHDAHASASEQRVEVVCRGGVGRTGTAIALLAGFAGVEPESAVAWARAHHHPRAAEVPWQRRWVVRVLVEHATGGRRRS